MLNGITDINFDEMLEQAYAIISSPGYDIHNKNDRLYVASLVTNDGMQIKMLEISLKMKILFTD